MLVKSSGLLAYGALGVRIKVHSMLKYSSNRSGLVSQSMCTRGALPVTLSSGFTVVPLLNIEINNTYNDGYNCAINVLN